MPASGSNLKETKKPALDRWSLQLHRPGLWCVAAGRGAGAVMMKPVLRVDVSERRMRERKKAVRMTCMRQLAKQ